jgi:hypothetical protein
MINRLSQQHYQCVEADDGAGRYWEIHLVKKYRVDYVDTIDLDDMGDWISREIKEDETHKVVDIRLVTWVDYQQEQYEERERKTNE